MRQLLRSSDVDSNGALFRELFLQRLPQSTRLVLAAAGDLTLDRLAQLADRVHDATSATVAALSSTPESSVVSRLESRIDPLAASIDALRTSPHDHRGVSTRQGHRASSPSSPRSRSPRGRSRGSCLVNRRAARRPELDHGPDRHRSWFLPFTLKPFATAFLWSDNCERHILATFSQSHREIVSNKWVDQPSSVSTSGTNWLPFDGTYQDPVSNAWIISDVINTSPRKGAAQPRNPQRARHMACRQHV
ncbi:hypothetical protein HPB50_019631 [Hyalomma asiaticum]|uniref:Uncharacterized protein n=1 Tax=Hyalomma asiaticum TaxID=266040 RepID=A0ACB7S7S9_HYAAI|nr:hypothetical protein HPB50_019631 [Hyalomma asiaticum]